MITRYRHRFLSLVFTPLVIATIGMPLGVIARPRPPLPPLPEFAPLLSRADFDEPFWARDEKPESFHPAYSDLVESWSGYAMGRASVAVTPFFVPALDGGGRTNVACASGAVRFWFRPYWSSGMGPGANARLADLSVVSGNSLAVNWSLNVAPDGTALFLTGRGSQGLVDLLGAPIAWQAGAWHLVALNYGPNESALFIDGERVATGGGVPSVAPADSALALGSSATGGEPAGGEFDEMCAFARPLSAAAVAFCYQLYAPTAARGPISAEEEAAQREVAAKRRAEREGGAQMMRLLGGASECITNLPIYITNIFSTNITGQGWTVTFDIQGTNAYGPLQDIFTTTNLTGDNITNSQWTWLERGPACSTYQYTNQPDAFAFYVLGTLLDSDNDGLTDAYENLVSKTSPTNANSPRAIYEGVISNQNPSAWFKLNDASFTNSVTTGQSLTNSNGKWNVDAFANGNGAYSFTNNADRLVVTNDFIGGGTGDATNQGSFTLLFKALTQQASSKRYVLSQGVRTSTTSGDAIAVYFDGTGTNGALKVGVGPNEPVILQDSNIVRGAWYYLAVTCDETRTNTSDGVRWYLGRVGSQTLRAGEFALGGAKRFGTNGAITLGNKENSNSAFRETPSTNGSIDQVAFWRRELTEAEVNAQFNTLHALFQGPSTVFDLTRWELTLPLDETNQLDNAHKPLDIDTVWLNSGFKYADQADGTQKYFYLSNGNQMVFEAPWNGADQDSASPGTNGSPRSELRETSANGDEFNWMPYDPATGTATNTHTLQATCRLENAPSKVIFGQIHTETPEPPSGGLAAITLFHEGTNSTNNRIRVAVYYSPDRSVTNAGSTDETFTLVSGVNLGDRIDYQLKIDATSGGAVTNYAIVSVNGGTPITRAVSLTSDPGYSGWGATNITLYFKAGCYYPKAATNSGTAKVTFSSLTATHQP